MYEFYNHLTDEEVEEKIKKLAPIQKERFEWCMGLVDDRRRALFVASSYPKEEE